MPRPAATRLRRSAPQRSRRRSRGRQPALRPRLSRRPSGRNRVQVARVHSGLRRGVTMAIVVLALWLFTAGAGFYLLVTSNLGRARPAATTPAAEPAPAESATVSASAAAPTTPATTATGAPGSAAPATVPAAAG